MICYPLNDPRCMLELRTAIMLEANYQLDVLDALAADADPLPRDRWLRSLLWDVLEEGRDVTRWRTRFLTARPNIQICERSFDDPPVQPCRIGHT